LRPSSDSVASAARSASSSDAKAPARWTNDRNSDSVIRT
jgi:hypothetical protein